MSTSIRHAIATSTGLLSAFSKPASSTGFSRSCRVLLRRCHALGWDLGAIYKEGATFNVTPMVTGTTVTLTATNSAQPMLVFVRGRWEILQTMKQSGYLATGQTNLYLNWQLVIVNNTVDPSLVDSATGEPTAEMGQLVLEVHRGYLYHNLNTALYFQQNSGPIVLFTFSVASGMALSQW